MCTYFAECLIDHSLRAKIEHLVLFYIKFALKYRTLSHSIITIMTNVDLVMAGDPLFPVPPPEQEKKFKYDLSHHIFDNIKPILNS